MPRLVVLGDSLTFHGPEGPLLLADPRLYPNVLAAALARQTHEPWDVAVVARAGWSLRDVWLALQKDVHLQQQVLNGAAAIVLAVGSTDPLPVGIPRAWSALVPYVRPTSARRALRRGIDRAHPHLVRATGASLRWTPASVYVHCWRKSVTALRLFAPDASLCAVLPGIHVGPYYGGSNRHRAAYADLTRALAQELDVPLVDLAALTQPWLGALNPDGLHWPFGLHDAVADALAAALLGGPQERQVDVEQIG
jgi:lysophospholipase L1-like esterase